MGESVMRHSFCNISESDDTIKKAAEILYITFIGADRNRWLKNQKEAFDEVRECIEKPNVCIGIKTEDKLIGWAGIRPMYEKTWELHPIVIKKEYQGKGYGRLLLTEIERIASLKGIIGLVAGSDDETNSTSLSEREINGENIFDEIRNVKNYRNHPYEFYRKYGYSIIGVIPNANGQNKPDIWLWKDIRKKDE
jgi:aminoglycoside 6'-N-acetyltransferase I